MVVGGGGFAHHPVSEGVLFGLLNNVHRQAAVMCENKQIDQEAYRRESAQNPVKR